MMDHRRVHGRSMSLLSAADMKILCQIPAVGEPNMTGCIRKERNMNRTMLTIMMATVVAVAAGVCRADTKTTYRDAQGRVQGTVTTDRYGKTTYRDARGRVQGSATTDRYGKTVYRDSLGRVQGSKTTR